MSSVSVIAQGTTWTDLRDRMFEVLDSNASGTITKDEIQYSSLADVLMKHWSEMPKSGKKKKKSKKGKGKSRQHSRARRRRALSLSISTLLSYLKTQHMHAFVVYYAPIYTIYIPNDSFFFLAFSHHCCYHSLLSSLTHPFLRQ